MQLRILIALPLLGLPFLTGCLEYERQTMSYRHDPTTDTLFIFQDYQGIFGADDPAKLSESEIEQMTSVLKDERTFFFSNWITEYNRAHLREVQQTPKGELDGDPAYEASIRTLVDLALSNVKVDNIGFYLDRANRLCGSQRVTVKNVSKVLGALNKLLPFVVRQEAGKEEQSDEEKKLLLQFAQSGRSMLELEGNRLMIRFPCAEADYREFKEDSAQGRAFQDSGGRVTYEDGAAVLILGQRDAKSVSLTMPFAENPYSNNAIPEAEKHGIKESFDAAEAAQAFLRRTSAAPEDRK